MLNVPAACEERKLLQRERGDSAFLRPRPPSSRRRLSYTRPDTTKLLRAATFQLLHSFLRMPELQTSSHRCRIVGFDCPWNCPFYKEEKTITIWIHNNVHVLCVLKRVEENRNFFINTWECGAASCLDPLFLCINDVASNKTIFSIFYTAQQVDDFGVHDEKKGGDFECTKKKQSGEMNSRNLLP